jgi:hypothetical protein
MAAISTIKMTITQLIGCLMISKLMISTLGPLVCPLLLYDAGHGSDDREADSNHEYDRDPVGRSPGDN